MSDEPKLSKEEADRLAEGFTPFWEAGDDGPATVQADAGAVADSKEAASAVETAPKEDPATAFPSAAPPSDETAPSAGRKKIAAKRVVSAKSLKPDPKKTMIGLAPPGPEDATEANSQLADAPAGVASDPPAASKAEAPLAAEAPLEDKAAAPKTAEPEKVAAPAPAAATPAPASARKPKTKSGAMKAHAAPVAYDEPYEPPVRKTNPMVYVAIGGIVAVILAVVGIKALSSDEVPEDKPAARTESVPATPPPVAPPTPKPAATETAEPSTEPTETAAAPDPDPEPAPAPTPKPVAVAPKPVAKPVAAKPVSKPAAPRPAPKPTSGSIVRETPF